MNAPSWSRAALLAALLPLAAAAAQGPPQEPAPPVEEAPAPEAAESSLSDVTVYQGTALVTRAVTVPQGAGPAEVVVTPLPGRVVPSSLYTEGGDGLRVLSTRLRARALREDLRDAVRDKEQEVRALQLAGQKLQAELEATRLDTELLKKLEDFLAGTARNLGDQGRFESTPITEMLDYLMATRAAKAEATTDLQEQIRGNAESLSFAERERAELSSGSVKTAFDAVILVDRGAAGGGPVRLSYLVGGASWRPQYRVRSGADAAGPVRLEYLAAVSQQSGEDWNGVRLTLSTAQPALNAAPPDLVPLAITVRPVEDGETAMVARKSPGMVGMGGMGGGMGGMGGDMSGMMGGMGSAPGAVPAAGLSLEQYAAQASQFRGQAQTVLNRNDLQAGGQLLNAAAAFDQARELLARDDDEKAKPDGEPEVAADGPTVSFPMPGTASIPSRADSLMVELKRLELPASYFDKAVPVLSPRVYRLARLTNSSGTVLLPGEATMYAGTDFVGRMSLPLVADGEPFTVGFGVDPQVQVHRRLMQKTRAQQGGNQVHTYEFRISVRNFRAQPVPLEVWDRLPRAADQDVAVNLVSTEPALSTDSGYLRNARNDNLLRWDLTVEPTAPEAVPQTISYQFRLEFAREMTIDQIASGALVETPVGGAQGGGFRQLPAPPDRD